MMEALKMNVNNAVTIGEIRRYLAKQNVTMSRPANKMTICGSPVYHLSDGRKMSLFVLRSSYLAGEL